MRCSKNKRKYKKRTKNRYAGQNALNVVENKSSSAFHSGVANAEGAVHTGVADAEGAVGKVTNSLSGMFRNVSGKMRALVPKGGKRQTRRKRRCRQRGGMDSTALLGGLNEVMNQINGQLPKLHQALGVVNAKAQQAGGKKRKKTVCKGGTPGEEDTQQANPEQANPEQANPEQANMEDNQMVKPTSEKINTASLSENKQENSNEEPETCTGFSKMFGLCKTKDVIAEKKRMKECIAKCAPPQKTEEKQSGGKVKKSKKKRKKRKNKSYKKRH